MAEPEPDGRGRFLGQRPLRRRRTYWSLRWPDPRREAYGNSLRSRGRLRPRGTDFWVRGTAVLASTNFTCPSHDCYLSRLTEAGRLNRVDDRPVL